ncbi:MAG: type IV pilus modification protein PilV [Spongiibacteraceae bacterium]
MTKHTQQGMTLIEVIVTMFIMAVGLLGLSGLQATSVKGGLDTAKRSQVTWLVTELVERMRANPDGLINYAQTINASQCSTIPTSCSSVTSANACSANQIATFDVWDVFCGQPSTDGELTGSPASLNLTSIDISCVDGTCNDANDNYTVTIAWTSTATNSSQILTAENRAIQEPQSLSMTVRP